MADILELKPFRDIPLNDGFFDSLKQDYKAFPSWFHRKISDGAVAYTQRTSDSLTGFMYLKIETGEVTDVTPVMNKENRIKIGTLKVEAHGTRLGERLIKKAFDRAIVEQAEEIYITVFPKHTVLIDLLKEFGFVLKGEKRTSDGVEDVFIKTLIASGMVGNLRKDYPLIDARNSRFYMIGIYPSWHSQLFPDSILTSENYDSLSDVSYTNSISKTYVSWIADMRKLRPRDIVVIYRTKENGLSAEYSSVATSICSVEEIRIKASFSDVDSYIAYTEPFSVFDKKQLKGWWSHENLSVTKMLYNTALKKRVIRKTLMENVGLDRHTYSGFMSLTQSQFLHIAELGGVDDRIIVR